MAVHHPLGRTATWGGFSLEVTKMVCLDYDKQKIIRANNPPSDSEIYIKELEETLISCFGQWKKTTAALYRYLGKDACEKVEDLDCIEWFCCAMKYRLTELRKQGKYLELSKGIVG